MLFWICLIVASVCLIGYAISNKCRKYALGEALCIISVVIYLIVGAMLIIIMVNYIRTPTQVAQTEQEYKIISYQIDHNMYNNNNEYGKKQLMNEAEQYNRLLVGRQTMQNDKWIGIFVPNVWDKPELIDYSNMK